MAAMGEFDVLILGGGPAGISAAMWADEFGFSSAIVDRGVSLGGQLSNVHNAINNFPGARFENGPAMASVMSDQIGGRSTQLLLGRDVVTADVEKRLITFEDGESVSGEALIIATGVRRRKLNVPGEDEFYRKGILESGAKDPIAVAGKVVAIVGGGDSAFENAVILSKYAKKVLLIHRRNEFSARSEFVDEVRQSGNIDILINSVVVGFSGQGKLGSVEVADTASAIGGSIDVDLALVRVGYEPNSDLFKGQLDLDPSGYIIVDHSLSTSLSGVFAAGDITRSRTQTIAAAIGDGATAISTYLTIIGQK